jgi:uncharacterized protein (UPF0332 family)
MTIHRDLLQQARRLAQLDPLRPRQANLRRAVSSAYYALFHYLTDRACRMMIGTQLPQAPYRQVIARGFDHGTMKEACRSFSGGNLPPAIRRRLPRQFIVPMALRNVARAFVELQEQRHSADYDLSQHLTRAEVFALVRQAEHALTHFDAVADRTLKKFFLSCLWAWKGISKR